jgi:hypothetical protein
MTGGVALKLGGFAGALALAFGGAFALGNTADPVAAADEPQHVAPASHEAAGGHDETGGSAPPGLAVSEAGYTLVPATASFAAPGTHPFRFVVTAPDGKPLTAYQRTHEKDLHLIAVRRDLSGFRHVHPTLGPDGSWSIPLELGTAGTWRVFADFTPAALGRTITLGTDVTVAGRFDPVPLPAVSTVAAVDGYEVTLGGSPVAGQESELTFTVRRDGRPVADLEPYLGAYGHLVSLRTGDLAFLHNHPGEEAKPGAKGGPEVRFSTTFPTTGTYRLYLDFQHAGSVRTAEFTVTVGAQGNQPAVTPTAPTAPTAATTSTPAPTHDATPHGH